MQVLVRPHAVQMTPALHDYIENRLGFVFYRFQDRIDRVTVTLADINGPKRGVDQQCEVRVRLRPSGLTIARAVDSEIIPALNRALDRVLRQMKARRKARMDRRLRTARTPNVF
jgi:putative sigma-54 modulation protein